MKTKITRIIMLLLITATQVATIFSAEEFVEYKNAAVIPICWKKDGTPFVLLGKEKRRRAETVWCDFFGKKDREDGNDPLITAKRETGEESAGVVELVGGPLHRYQGRRNTSTVHFIWQARYIDPETIRERADAMRKIGKGGDIEKTDWRWEKLEDLLNEETGLILHPFLTDKLKHRVMGPWFRSLLERELKEEEG